MADSDEHPVALCDAALARVFEFLGKRWNGVILGALTTGATGFADLARGVPGISDSVLSDRLAGLVQAGLITRTVEAGPPVSVTYSLTAAGHGLVPALTELTSWARRHLPMPADEGTVAQRA